MTRDIVPQRAHGGWDILARRGMWLTVMLAALHLLGLPAVATAATDPERLAPGHAAVVSIVAYDAARTVIAQGNGVFVDAQGLILTNYHLVAPAPFVVVSRAGMAPAFATALIYTDRQWDLAMIRIEGQQFPVLPLAKTDRLSEGLPVVVSGSSAHGKPVRTEGTIRAIRAVAETQGLLQLSIRPTAVRPGSPVLTHQGEVVGLMTPRLTPSGPEGAVAVSLPILHNFLREASALSVERPFVVLPSLQYLNGEAIPPQTYYTQARNFLQQQCQHMDLVDMILSQALALGVPFYNRGQHRECYSIYEAFSYKVLFLLGSQCDGVYSILRAALVQAFETHVTTDQAWILRRAFDLIGGVPTQAN